MRAKSLSEEDFCEVLLVPCGEESFVLDSDACGFFVLEHTESEAADEAEVGVGVTFADAALVFAERHVELPVQAVFDTPVTACGFGEAAAGKIASENIIANSRMLLSVASDHTRRHTDGADMFPASEFLHARGHRADHIAAMFLTAMTVVACRSPAGVRFIQSVFDDLVEVPRDRRVQLRLIGLHCDTRHRALRSDLVDNQSQ